MGYARFFMPFVNEARGYDFKGRNPAGRAIVESRDGATKLSVVVQDLKTETRYSVYLVFSDMGRFAGVLAGSVNADAKGKGEMRKDIKAASLGKFDISKLTAVAVLVENRTGMVTAPLVGYREKPVSWKNSFYAVKDEKKDIVKEEPQKREDFRREEPRKEEPRKEEPRKEEPQNDEHDDASFVEEVLQQEVVEEPSTEAVPTPAVVKEAVTEAVVDVIAEAVVAATIEETATAVGEADVAECEVCAVVVECVCTAASECISCKENCATCGKKSAAVTIETDEVATAEVEEAPLEKAPNETATAVEEKPAEENPHNTINNTPNDDTLKEDMERISESLRRQADAPRSHRPMDAEPFRRRKASQRNFQEIQEIPTASLQKNSPKATKPPEKITPPRVAPPPETSINPTTDAPPEAIPLQDKIPPSEATESEKKPAPQEQNAATPSAKATEPAAPTFTEPPDFTPNREESIAALEGIFNGKKPISPFPNQTDDTVWIRLTINDAVPLPQSLPNLLEEPFVRAAYANFGHLILGLSPDRAEYVIGVPGEYSQELRPQAKGLGFSSFRTGKNELVRPGDNGYWLLFVGL